ncbi:MAG: SDR family NAD(P)-dependent oxidoreductase [Candidatus Poribacteria bacterium]|nr:SDR family NAD(P)-dependent oxidoreductase [Candidatus Poribacteria bacterium]
MRLKDKVALFAGAGSNMSRATALLFAQEGAKVVLAARTTETMEETAERIRANGGDVLTHQTDLMGAAQVDALVDAAVAEFGGIDCLIHAAGGFFSTEHDITTMEPAYWDGALQNNLQTLFNPVRRLVPILEARGGGCLITISAGERVRQDANSAYAVAKAGMVAAAKNLAKELYDKNIRVHALSPGIIWDPLPDGEIAPAATQLERLGNPIDVAYAALWLCSDEAAWVTGLELTIDGGDSLFIDSPVRRKVLE